LSFEVNFGKIILFYQKIVIEIVSKALN